MPFHLWTLFYALCLQTLFPQLLLSSALHTKRVAPVSASAKAGLAWPNGDYDDMGQYLSTGKVSWYYTWNPAAINEDDEAESVPMLWGATQVNQWTSSVNSTISSKKVTAVLGMNEPNEVSQSNLTAQQGAVMWKTYIEPLKSRGVRLGTPATTSAPSGIQWVKDWLVACDGGCTVDFVALHWYDVNATNFIEYIQEFHNTFQKPIWVTEWDCQNNNTPQQCSLQDIMSFMNITQSFMDNTDWVERYAWFGAMENLQGVNPSNALMDSSGKITALGRQYIGANSTAPLPSSSGSSPGVSGGGSSVVDYLWWRLIVTGVVLIWWFV
ncbi:glycoside hydrolase family 128 protein [Jaapia argillacea MUCL 33604]|uniref:Glycoside hydrolase family 128 protein n=1 Tax=Jaapia argillacea MUCL 33604 TaxID=933084 RepID=A0A067PMP8_9AGAM|nr:glycoside hydrolase family 128 protein [Jaapia argillacea MUCL 33604]